MLKRFLIGPVLALTLASLIAVPTLAATGTMIVSHGLYIKTGPINGPGWQTPVGVVETWKDGDDYTVRIAGAENWYILEAHFDYGNPATFEGIPRTPNKANNPIPGKFDWGVEFWGDPQTEVEFQIGAIAAGDYAFIAHAVVGYSTDGGATFEADTIQTAWGDCSLFPSSKWAKYWFISLE
jgi:hypothetical protein